MPRYHGDDVAEQVAARKALTPDESLAMVAKIKAALEEDEEPPTQNKL